MAIGRACAREKKEESRGRRGRRRTTDSELTTTLIIHVIITYVYIWATVCQSQHGLYTECQAFIMNSDERESQTSQKKRASDC